MLIEEERSRPTSYVELLSENSSYRRLWLGQVVSYLGDWFNTVAVLGLVLQLTQRPLAAGLTVIASTLPAFFLSPVAGVLVDRLPRRTVMITSDLLRMLAALGFLLVRSPDQIWLVYVFTGLLVSVSSFFYPASTAAIPNLVRRRELLTANALSSATWGVMLTVGAALGGIVSGLFGRDIAFIANSASFLFSAAMIASIRGRFEEEHDPTVHRPGGWHELGQGISFVGRRRDILGLILAKGGWGLGGGVIVLLSIFGQQVYHGGDLAIGILYSARGLGALIGPLLARPFSGTDTGRIKFAIAAGIAVSGLGYIGFGLAPGVIPPPVVGGSGIILLLTLILPSLCVLVAHAGGGTMWVLSTTLLQQLSPDRFRGRVFAVDNGLQTLTIAISTLLMSAGSEHLPAEMVAIAGGLILLTYGVLWGIAAGLRREQRP